MGPLFHVSSRRNRESITQNGLDWRLMANAPGIAGSNSPEVAGVFLCVDRFEADYFLRMNNTGGPVDVWQIDGIEVEELLDAGSGYLYLPRPVHSSLVRLTALDGQQPVRDEQTPVGPSDAYSSDLAFTFDQEPREPDE